MSNELPIFPTPRVPQHVDAATHGLWALGFRPFYLLGALYAALAAPLWALQFGGWLPLQAIGGAIGHAHEMVFGYALAVMVGFLFTAGRNWSGQPTPSGRSLQALVLMWIVARVLAYLPWPIAAMLANLAFAWGAAYGLGRALVAGNNRRNYFFVGLLAALGLVSALVHAQAAGWVQLSGAAALQLGLDVVLFVMAVMAGRVVPMFTNNGVPGAAAARHAKLEPAVLAGTLLLLAADAAAALGLALTGSLLVPALLLLAAAHALRWWLWQPWTTLRTPLVWVLHLAYLWIPVHLLLRAGALGLGWPPGPATHALTTGAIGLLTLAMMTRSARGHTGQPLKADAIDVASYLLVAVAAVLRTAAPLAWPPSLAGAALLSSLCWATGWLLFALHYGPWLAKPRLDGRPG